MASVRLPPLEGAVEAGRVQRVGSMLSSASSIINVASFNLSSYQSAELALAGVLPVPAKKRGVRFLDEHAVHEHVAPEPQQLPTLKSPHFDHIIVKCGMHRDAATAWRGAMLRD